MTGFLSRRLGKGHIFGTDVALTAGESFGGIFMGLFCLSPFSVKFALLTGEPPAEHMTRVSADSWVVARRDVYDGHNWLTYK